MINLEGEKELLRVGERAEELALLKESRAWKRLILEYEDRKEKKMKVLLRSILSGAPVDQREIDYYRGFWSGCQWILDNPDLSELSLQRTLIRARKPER